MIEVQKVQLSQSQTGSAAQSLRHSLNHAMTKLKQEIHVVYKEAQIQVQEGYEFEFTALITRLRSLVKVESESERLVARLHQVEAQQNQIETSLKDIFTIFG